MATVYILKSEKLNRFYIGSTIDLENRIEQHLSKMIKGSYTSTADDWKLFLKIENLSHQQARKIELHIKKMKSRIYYSNLINYPEIIERLKLKYT
jgi:putative endonuclease